MHADNMYEKIIFIICSVAGAVHLQIVILKVIFLKNPHKNALIYIDFYENVNSVFKH
jgi:hypothetical protein